jgi:hypothetical protein
MNTPAHAVLNLAVLGRKDRPETAAPIVAGAVLPDVPIFLFYGYERWIERAPERAIWSSLYFDPGWQAVFDLAHSLPLMLAGFAIAARLGARRWAALALSMALHAAVDFCVHAEDAHRHFFPFSDWRFHSPLSYWDPRHHGLLGAGLEAGLVVVSSIALYRRYPAGVGRAVVVGLASIYVLGWGFALIVRGGG